jgi:hypothetical protein
LTIDDLDEILRTMMRINKDRFERYIVAHSFETDQGSAVRLHDLWNALRYLQCKADGCDNEARYTEGHCGIHDLEFNNGKGKRITHPE